MRSTSGAKTSKNPKRSAKAGVYEVGAALVLKGTGSKWKGQQFKAVIVDVRGSDPEPRLANTVKVKYDDGGFRRFKTDDFSFYVIPERRPMPRSSPAQTNSAKAIAPSTKPKAYRLHFPTESQMRMGGLIKDRVWLFKTWKQCFVGQEVVRWMMSVGLADSPKQAVALGQGMVNARKIYWLGSKKFPFQNAFIFYRWAGSEYWKNGGTKPEDPTITKDSAPEDDVFSSSLDKRNCAMAPEPGYPLGMLPKLLLRLWSALITVGGLKREGVFRHPADKKKLSAAKQRLNPRDDYSPLEENNGGLVGAGADVICELIKTWFRRLNPKLLDFLTSESLTIAAEDDQIQKVILSLPEPQYSVFLWLLDRIKEISSYNKYNSMTVKSLAVMLAPSLYSEIESCLLVIAFIEASVEWRNQSLRESMEMIRRRSVDLSSLSPMDDYETEVANENIFV